MNTPPGKTMTIADQERFIAHLEGNLEMKQRQLSVAVDEVAMLEAEANGIAETVAEEKNRLKSMIEARDLASDHLAEEVAG